MLGAKSSLPRASHEGRGGSGEVVADFDAGAVGGGEAQGGLGEIEVERVELDDAGGGPALAEVVDAEVDLAAGGFGESEEAEGRNGL